MRLQLDEQQAAALGTGVIAVQAPTLTKPSEKLAAAKGLAARVKGDSGASAHGCIVLPVWHCRAALVDLHKQGTISTRASFETVEHWFVMPPAGGGCPRRVNILRP